MSNGRESSQPPQPAPFQGKIAFYPFQLIGIPLIFLIPTLAFMGLISETKTVTAASGNGFVVEITYSNRLNFQSRDDTEIAIRNTTDVPIPSLTVTIDKAYLDNFSDRSFMPALQKVTEDGYVIEVTDLQPNETYYVGCESRGATAGAHQGTIIVSAGEDTVSLTLDTFIFP